MAEKSKYQDIDAVDAALDKGVAASESVTDLEQEVGDMSSAFQKSVNLYDYTKRTQHSVISTNGQIVILDTYTTDSSDYIEVVEKDTIVFSVNGVTAGIKRRAFYDENKDYIEGTYAKADVASVDVPEGAKYIRVTANSSSMVVGFQIQTGEVSSYEPYGLHVKKTVFVSTSGSDESDGSLDHPFNTFAMAIRSGAEMIYVEAGDYTENIIVRNKKISFCVYNGEHFSIDASSLTLPAIKAEKCDIFINGMIACNTTNGRNGFELLGCTGTVKNCEAYNCAKDGFELGGSSLDLYNCYSHDNSVDGIGAHAYEDYKANVSAHNCACKNNADDGLSFHDSECCNIYGGEFSNNTNGGVVPYGQSVINVYNAIIESNDIGLYGFQSGTISDNPKIVSNGNLIKSNRVGIKVQYYDCISINDHVVDNTTEKAETEGTITTY